MGISSTTQKNAQKIAQKAQNGPKWPRVVKKSPNGPIWPRIAQMAQNSQKGPKWPKTTQMAQNGKKGPECIVLDPDIASVQILQTHCSHFCPILIPSI